MQLRMLCLAAMADDQDDDIDKLSDLATAHAERTGTDLLVFNGPMYRPWDDSVIDRLQSRERHDNVLMILTTLGGDPNVAYRIARALQRFYKKFSAFVPGYCKSAGTLLAIGAHELVMGRHAELGPLDVQVRSDEVGERGSGMAPNEAFSYLSDQTSRAFAESFSRMRYEMGLPTRLAAETTASLIGSFFGPIYGQIDPIRLGELSRASTVALAYGQRLDEVAKNTRESALVRLVAGYSSHGFVIDTEEAKQMFKNVREATVEEERFTKIAGRAPLDDDRAYVFFLNHAKGTQNAQPTPPANVQPSVDGGAAASAPAAGAGPGGGAQAGPGDAPTG